MNRFESLPCYRCTKEVPENAGVWVDGVFYCSRCYNKTPPKEVSPPIYIKGMGPDAPKTKEGLESSLPYDLTLIPPEFLFCLSALLKEGAEEYGEGNWKMLSYRTNLNHALCHTLADLAGDSQEDHLVNAVARLIFAWWIKKEEETHESRQSPMSKM